MSKQCILKDIEKLKQANTFLETLFADIENYKSKEGTSYPVGIPNFSHSDELQINYNKMCIDILEYFVEKLGDKEELNIGKYFTCWLDMCETRIRIDFSLNNENEVSSKLYNEVFGSWSDIYIWTKNNLLPLLSLVANKYLDFEDTIDFFERVGTEDDNRQLAWSASTYTKGADAAKKIIDDIFNLAEDKEVLKDMDEVLDVYFDKVFKYNKEEY